VVLCDCDRDMKPCLGLRGLEQHSNLSMSAGLVEEGEVKGYCSSSSMKREKREYAP
jgi:hypothetical protein